MEQGLDSGRDHLTMWRVLCLLQAQEKPSCDEVPKRASQQKSECGWTAVGSPLLHIATL